MPTTLQYPLGGEYANEIPFWCVFSCSPYSVDKNKRTRSYIATNSNIRIYLPFTSEPKMTMEHKFSEGTNPVGPVLNLSSLMNTTGGPDAFLERLSSPVAAFYETTFTTDTYRRFSNITEASLTSEARRNFSFKYLFVPKTEAEAVQVDEIVTTFRNLSYPKAVPTLPERSYPQNLWTIQAMAPGGAAPADYLTNSWLGDPLVCVLASMEVDRGDPSDPVLKILPNGRPVATLMSINFMEFETGTYVESKNKLMSKSEVAAEGRFI